MFTKYLESIEKDKKAIEKIKFIFSNNVSFNALKKLKKYLEDWKHVEFNDLEIKFLENFCNDRNLIGKTIYRQGNKNLKRQFTSFSLLKKNTNYFKYLNTELIKLKITENLLFIDIESYFKNLDKISMFLSNKDNLNKNEIKLLNFIDDSTFYNEKEILIFNKK